MRKGALGKSSSVASVATGDNVLGQFVVRPEVEPEAEAGNLPQNSQAQG